MTNIAIISRGGEEVENHGDMGEPLPGIDAEVMDENGKLVGKDGLGELVFRGAQVCLGYYNNPEATAELFRDGWLHSGDIVRIDSLGRFHFVDRAKDMIKSGGENVYSLEVERVLREFPGIAEVAVIGVPDKRWGEAVKAVVVFVPGVAADLEGLDQHCIENLGGFKRPRWYEVVERLPRNATMKIVKNVLRDAHDPSTSVRLNERS